jgi:hypothetical protein
VVVRVRAVCVIASALCALAGCDNTRLPTPPSAHSDGGHTTPAHHADASKPPSSGSDHDASASPNASFDAMLPQLPMLPDHVCALWVGAECDGSEDCPTGSVCCGELVPGLPTYRSISCRTSCDAPLAYELCHIGGEPCSDGSMCSRSTIIPQEFIGVCLNLPDRSDKPTGKSIRGRIECGASTCRVGAEKCCLRSELSAAGGLPQALAPFCQPVDAFCYCEDEALPITQDGGRDNDGG